jgi:L-lactate dehydrogenase complex protein LldG
MSRDQIFSKVRTAVAGGAPIEERRKSVAARLANPVRHPLPERIKKSPEELTKLFNVMLKACLADVVEVDTKDAIPSAITGYLREKNLPQRVVLGGDDYLAALPWSNEPTLERKAGRAEGPDQVGVSHATAGVAETGTIVMASGADNPVTINFLPETHIVVVEEKDIVGPYEDAFAKVTARFGKGKMPRTVNMISGPSRSADIGGRLVIGAHGPRRMCVVIVRER